MFVNKEINPFIIIIAYWVIIILFVFIPVMLIAYWVIIILFVFNISA